MLLATVILVRSTSYAFNKIAAGTMGTFTLLSDRFLLAFLVLVMIFWKKIAHTDKESLKSGAIIGTFFFIVMSLEVMALQLAPSSTVGFLQNTAVVFVPIFGIFLLKNKPDKKVFISVTLAIVGVALMSLQEGISGSALGITYAILSAMSYAMAIIMTDRFSKKGDALLIGIYQLAFMGGWALLFACIFEEPRLPNTQGEWMMIIFLAVLCSSFGYAFQTVAQKHTTAEIAGLFTALAPIGAGVTGLLILGEGFTVQSLAGAVLILASIVISQKK